MSVRWIAHRGFAAGRPGGTPTRQTLQNALDIAVDVIEIDVHLTSDGVLVVRHDSTVRGGERRSRRLARMTYAELKRLDPAVLTLGEVDTFVAGRVPLLLDVKGRGAVRPLATWLAVQPDPQRHIVCTPHLDDLITFSQLAPATPRWATFPDLDSDARTALSRILAAITHRRPEGETNQLLRDVIRAARDVIRDHDVASATLGGLSWRDGLPRELAGVMAATGASGISVHQWLVTPALVDAAHVLGMTVTAWTVNRADALAAVTRAGVDYVTSDDPGSMRRLLPFVRHFYPEPRGVRAPLPFIEPPQDQRGVA